MIMDVSIAEEIANRAAKGCATGGVVSDNLLGLLSLAGALRLTRP